MIQSWTLVRAKVCDFWVVPVSLLSSRLHVSFVDGFVYLRFPSVNINTFLVNQMRHTVRSQWRLETILKKWILLKRRFIISCRLYRYTKTYYRFPSQTIMIFFRILSCRINILYFYLEIIFSVMKYLILFSILVIHRAEFVKHNSLNYTEPSSANLSF